MPFSGFVRKMAPEGTDVGKTETANKHASIGIKALPRTLRDEHFPGHVGVSWKVNQERVYRGFRFVVTDLPEEFQSPSKWRSYLFDHRVPGYVENDVMLRDAHHQRIGDMLCRDWPASEEALTEIEAESVTGPRGGYSFNPKPEEDTHNCVTWAFLAINRSLGEILPPVRDGRIRLAIIVLLEHGAHEPS